MKLKKRFSEQDLQRINAAVQTAEEKISGEIVPVIVEKSDDYVAASYKAGIICAALAFVTMVILDRYVISDTHTLYYDPLFLLVVVAVCGVLGGVITNYVDGLKRFFISRAYLDVVTRQRAESVFLEEEIFNTRQRTGIMIFISFFEHEVIVLADRGINQVVEQKEWDNVVAGLVTKIRSGHLTEGLEWAIGRCGEILLEKGFHKTADDINELGDDLRITK